MRRYFEELKDFTKKGDMFLLGMCVCLALFGVVAIASATSADKFGESNFKYLAIQLVSIGLGWSTPWFPPSIWITCPSTGRLW